jgi:hypothetical protein
MKGSVVCMNDIADKKTLLPFILDQITTPKGDSTAEKIWKAE